MASVVTVRGIFFLVLATFFFLAFYSLTGVPEPVTKVAETNYSIDLEEIITTLCEENWTCHRYYRQYGRTGSTLSPARDQIVLYQPPCPLGDQADFRYLINRDICGTDEVYMMILVGSHPQHLAVRNVIRQTYGNPKIPGFSFKLAFVFGQVMDAEQQRLLEEESRNYSDILQGSFVDSYRNVTLRDLMGLRWVWQYCNQAKFVMRADDDVSVDIFSLIDALEEHFGDAPDFVGCFQMMVGTPVLRTGRYTVTKAEHPLDTYEPYCQGWMYMLTPHMAYNLDLAALRVKPYWMNDAYLTGTLVKALGKVPQDLKVNYTISVSDMEEAKDRDAKLPPKYTVGPTEANEELIYILHQNYKYFAKLNGLPRRKWTKRRKLLDRIYGTNSSTRTGGKELMEPPSSTVAPL